MSWAESARELEALGYSTLFAPDHFDEGFGPITAMATAAAATTELTVATAVFAADFRHPAVLARELASIDVLSEGRLEVGLGAGYQVNDYRGSGIAMDPPKVRVDRLIEYVAVLRGLFADGPFTYAGEHFQIDALDGTPHPFTPGGPPIFVAGGGPRMLRFAAREADIVGVNPSLPTTERRAEARHDGVAARDRREVRPDPRGGRRALRRPRLPRLAAGRRDHRRRPRRGDRDRRRPRRPRPRRRPRVPLRPRSARSRRSSPSCTSAASAGATATTRSSSRPPKSSRQFSPPSAE